MLKTLGVHRLPPEVLIFNLFPNSMYLLRTISLLFLPVSLVLMCTMTSGCSPTPLSMFCNHSEIFKTLAAEGNIPSWSPVRDHINFCRCLTTNLFLSLFPLWFCQSAVDWAAKLHTVAAFIILQSHDVQIFFPSLPSILISASLLF